MDVDDTGDNTSTLVFKGPVSPMTGVGRRCYSPPLSIAEADSVVGGSTTSIRAVEFVD